MKTFFFITAAIILLLLVPVAARWNTEPVFTLDIKYFFFKKRLLPKEKKEPAAKKPEGAQPMPAKKKKPALPVDTKELIELLPRAVKKLSPPVQRLLRRTTVADFYLRVVVVGSDAADTAIKFGEANAAVFSLIALADRAVLLKTQGVDIIAGFSEQKSSAECRGELRAVPLAVIIAAASILIKALILALPLYKGRKSAKEKDILQKNDRRKEDSDGKEKSTQRGS